MGDERRLVCCVFAKPSGCFGDGIRIVAKLRQSK
jgi:hypothetical protein